MFYVSSQVHRCRPRRRRNEGVGELRAGGWDVQGVLVYTKKKEAESQINVIAVTKKRGIENERAVLPPRPAIGSSPGNTKAFSE